MRYFTLGWLWLAAGLLSFGPGPGFRDRYQALMRQHKTKEAAAVVQQWEKAQPRDPDLYVAKYNLILSDAEALSLSTRPAQTGEFSVTNQETGQAVGSIGPGYDPLKVKQANDELRKGLRFAPDRLDMRFGIAYAAKLIGDAPQQYQAVQEALAWRASAQGKPWRWRDGQPLPEPEAEFVPATVEEYMVPYWQSEAPEQYQHGLALAELLIQYYPQSSLGYFNKGAYYSFVDNPTEARQWLMQADKLQPNDPATVGNLLHASLKAHDKPAAQGYLARLCELPGQQEQCQHFTEEINKL